MELIYSLFAGVTLGTKQGASDDVVLCDARGLYIRPRGDISRVSSFHNMDDEAEKEGATMLLYYVRYRERVHTLVPPLPRVMYRHIEEEDPLALHDYGLFVRATREAKSFREQRAEEQERQRPVDPQEEQDEAQQVEEHNEEQQEVKGKAQEDE